MIELRPMQESDLEWVLVLDRETEGAPHWSEAVYKEYSASRDQNGALRRFALLAERDGARAGLAMGRLLLDGVENVCELEWIAVPCEGRRSGIGRALMEGVAAWCRKHGGLRLMLEVRAANETAQRLYRRSGWAETGRRTGYYRDPEDDAVLMERLDPPGEKAAEENR